VAVPAYSEHSLWTVEHLPNDEVALKGYNGHYLSVNSHFQGIFRGERGREIGLCDGHMYKYGRKLGSKWWIRQRPGYSQGGRGNRPVPRPPCPPHHHHPVHMAKELSKESHLQFVTHADFPGCVAIKETVHHTFLA